MNLASGFASTFYKLKIHYLLFQNLTTFKETLGKSEKSLTRSLPNLDNPLLLKLERCQNLNQFNQIHCLMITTGLYQDTFAASRLLLISLSSLKPPNICLSYLTFLQIQNPDVFSYNIIIKASAQTTRLPNSLHLYNRLLRRGLCPNEYTFCFLLTSCAQNFFLQEGKQVHAQFIKHSVSSNSIFANTSLISMYGKCGEIDEALQVFEEMPEKGEASWGAIVDSYISHGFLMEGLLLFAKLRSYCVKATNATLVTALCACAKLQYLKCGKTIHGHIEVLGLELNVTLGTSLVDMYSKCGEIDLASEIFSQIPTKSVASWNCMIHGLAMNGRGIVAVDLFKEMLLFGLKPNSATFVGLLQACSHTGLVDDALVYFSSMTNSHDVHPSVRHYGCMVDLYCRAGRLEKAIEVIRTMSIKPDIVIWGALSGGCRKYGHAKLGELVGVQMLKLEPPRTSCALNLSDMYAMDGRWDDMMSVRSMDFDGSFGREGGFSTLT